MVIDALTIAGIVIAVVAIIALVRVCHATGGNCFGKK
jgi:hypothetical protein